MKPVHQSSFKSISLSTFYSVGFCPLFRLWDFVLWDSVLWDFVRRDFVLWDFVLWDSVRIPYPRAAAKLRSKSLHELFCLNRN